MINHGHQGQKTVRFQQASGNVMETNSDLALGVMLDWEKAKHILIRSYLK